MNPELQLIQQIRELVQGDFIERGPVLEDFADQFAELCHGIIARIQRCGEYLDKGMRSEAVHEVQSPPNLLQLIEAANFPELKKWRNICADLELGTFPTIPENAVQRLHQECSREADLDPLLKNYRRAVYQADRDEQIRILRELREKDALNPSWKQNLYPLEEQKLHELRDLAAEALQNEDLPTLKFVYAELTHPQRAVPAPSNLLAQLKDALLGERREETLKQGKVLSLRLGKALEAQDDDSVLSLLDAWEKLETDEAFEPNADMRAIAGQARDWRERKEQEDKRKTDFDKQVEDMWSFLQTGKPEEVAITRRQEKLETHGYPLPEALSQAIAGKVAECRTAKNARRRLVAGVVLLIVVATIAAIALGGFVLNQKKIKTTVVTKLSALLEQGEYEEMNTYLEALRENRPKLYNSEDVRHFAETAGAKIREREQKQEKFSALFAELTHIRQEGYRTDSEKIQAILAEAKQTIPAVEEQKKVDAWEITWDAWRTRQQEQIDQGLERVTLDINQVLRTRKQSAFNSLATERRTLDKTVELVTEGKLLATKATTEKTANFTAAAAAVNAWKLDFERRVSLNEAASERLVALKQEIPESLPDIEQYTVLLKEFVTKFPESPESKGYQRALRNQKSYKQVVSLQRFRLAEFPPDARTAAHLRKQLEESLRGSVWETELKSCLDYVDGVAQVKRRLPLLLASKGNALNTLMLRYRRKGEVSWKKLYHPKPFFSRLEKDADGNEYRAYWGKVYWSASQNQSPTLIHSSKIFPNKLNELEYDIVIQPNIKDNIVPYGKFLYRFVSGATEAEELDFFILDGIKKLIADEDIAFVPRAWVLKNLVHFLEDNFPHTPQCAEMTTLVDALPVDVPWMNPLNLDVIEADEKIETALKDFPDIDSIKEQMRRKRALLVQTLNRQVECVGSFQQNEEGELLPRFTGQTAGAEIWVLLKYANGTRPYFKLIGKVDERGKLRLQPDTESDLFPGQLAFSPGDRKDSADLLRQALIDKKTQNETKRPAAWPANIW